MNKVHFDFVVKVAALVAHYTQFPEDVCIWIGCQFALESTFGTSGLAENNNYCGMKNPLVRISTALHAGDANYHWAQYDNLDSCVVDYLLCVQYHRPISVDYDTIKHYSGFISKFYCPERGYIDKINLIYQQFKLQQNGKTN